MGVKFKFAAIKKAVEGECLPELGWGSMRLSVDRQGVHKAGGSQ